MSAGTPARARRGSPPVSLAAHTSSARAPWPHCTLAVTRAFLVVHPVLCLQRYVHLQVKKVAEERYPHDTEKQKAMTALKANQFTAGPEVCAFTAHATLKDDGIVRLQPDKCNLTHSHACPVVSGKVKAKMLTKDPWWGEAIAASDGKSSAAVLRNEAAKAGLGGDAASDNVLYRAKRATQKMSDIAWRAAWDELPRYLRKLEATGDVYVTPPL
jgi:hypothetical protein